MKNIASNWPELRRSAQAKRDDDVHVLERDGSFASKLLDRPAPALARVFVNSPEPLARLVVASGADVAKPHFHLLKDALPALLRHKDEAARSAPASALNVLSYVLLARCVDLSLPDETEDIEARWLGILAARPDLLNDFGIRTAALASVAVGEEALVPDWVGGGLLVPRSTPSDIAGPNVPGLARHLAEVIQGGGGVDAVEGSWWSFLSAFPLTLASDGVRWIDLVWAAFTMMVCFEGRTATDVGKWLPKLVGDLE